MIDPVRQEVIALAHTVVVKVGTNVLTRRRRHARPGAHPGAGRPGPAHPRRAAARSPWSAPGPSAPASAGSASASGPTDLRHLQACAAVGQSFLMRAYEDCLARHGIHDRPDPADRRRLRQPDALPQRPQHHPHPVRVGLPADHQRERHRQRRRDPLRRQRPPGRDGDQPAAGAAADPADRRGRPVLRRPAAPTPTAELVTTVPHIDAAVLDMAGSSQSTLGIGRHAEQAAGRPAGDGGRRVGHHGQRRAAGRPRRHLRGRAGRHAVPAARQRRCRRGSAGSATRPGRAAGWWSTPARAARSQHQGRSLLPIGVVQVAGVVRQGRRGGDLRRRRRRVRPRPDQLLRRRRRTASAACAPSRSARCWARCPTRRWSTATTWWCWTDSLDLPE